MEKYMIHDKKHARQHTEKHSVIRVVIARLHHGLPSVDNIKLVDEKALFLFNYR